MEQVGFVAQCMRPRIYFRDNGIFGKTDCHFDEVVALNCSGSGLVEEFVPEAAAQYSSMYKLSRIDVSNIPQLRRVPRSWSLIPGLRTLNMSGCGKFAGLSFDLCAKETVRNIVLDGTLAQTSLNWSGQLLGSERAAASNSPPSLSQACASTLGSTLKTLDLSHNNFSLGKDWGVGFSSCEKTYETESKVFGKVDVNISEIAFIGVLGELTRLVLSHNRISALSVEFFSLTEYVEHVVLSGNPIYYARFLSTPPEQTARVLHSLQGFSTLKCLEITAGGAEGVLDPRSAFARLHGLEEIFIFNNGGLTAIAPAFTGPPSLRVLRFEKNAKLASLAPQMFAALPRVRRLQLDDNRLTSVDPYAFSGLVELEWLDLENNALTSIDTRTFAGLSSLTRLELADNQLAAIAPQTFARLDRLRHLSLHGNGVADFATAVNKTVWGLNETVVISLIRGQRGTVVQ